MTSVCEVLIKLSIKFQGDFDCIWDAIANKLQVIDDEVDKQFSDLKSGTACLVQDDLYPRYLTSIYKAPFVLYYYGDISLIKDYRNNLAIVGARDCSDYGISTTRKIISELNKDIVIVSGLARGIDSVAHEAAIKNGLKTIAVLGNGIDTCYPPQNNKLLRSIVDHGGLVISEYPFKTQPNPINFPMRNRIIAAISSAILVTEAKSRSGTEITVNRGLELGREILCIPYPFDADSFCNRIISEGATLVYSSNQINELYEFKK